MLIKIETYPCTFEKYLNSRFADQGVIITDPPYNIGFRYNQYKDNLPDADYIRLIANFKDRPVVIIHYPEETMKYILPALGVPSEVVTWCYNSNLPRQSRLICFYNVKPDFSKIKQNYKNPNDKRIQKRIAAGSTGTPLYDWWRDIQPENNMTKAKEGNTHPCPVPVALMKRIIELTTKEGDLVIDPFMGSGTCSLAAIQSKRNFVGFEIDPEYYQLARTRIRAAA